MPKRVTGQATPISASCSSTPDPKPPVTTPSSRVKMRPVRAASRTASSSMGLTQRMSQTARSMPCPAGVPGDVTRDVDHAPDRQQRAVVPIFEFEGPSLPPRLAGRGSDGSGPTRIADGDRTLEVNGAAQGGTQLLAIRRSQNAHAGYHAQVHEIEDAMMRRAIVTYETGPVQAEE